MPRRCLTCWHPKRKKIEAALHDNLTLRDVSEAYGIGKDALQRHWKNCFPQELPDATPSAPVVKPNTSSVAPNSGVPATRPPIKKQPIAPPDTSPAAQFVIVHPATGNHRVVTGKYWLVFGEREQQKGWQPE